MTGTERTNGRDERPIVLEARSATYCYPGYDEPALREVSLAVRQGEFVLLTGASGCGKSTLLRAFLGLVPHLYGGELAGSVVTMGEDVTTTLPHLLASRVGFVFQNPEDQLTAAIVESDVAFGTENLGFGDSEINRRVTVALDAVGIESLRHRSVHAISNGQQQKVAIAGILAMEPEVLLLDEPTSQLDPRSARDVLDHLAEIRRQRALTVVLSEHRLDLAAPIADRLVVMDDGRVVADGPMREVVISGELERRGLGTPRIARVFAGLGAFGSDPANLSSGPAQPSVLPTLPLLPLSVAQAVEVVSHTVPLQEGAQCR